MRRAYVYRSPLGDSTGGGVSSREDAILILDPNEDAPATVTPLHFREELRAYGIKKVDEPDYLAAVPLISPPDMVGPMFGGNLAFTSGSDGKPARLWRIHDRFETVAQYAALSI